MNEHFPKSRWLLVVFLYLTIAQAEGQTIAPATGTISRLGLDEGLPHRTVLSASRDALNMLWLVTEAGLFRYDGYEIASFNDSPRQFKDQFRPDADSLLLARSTAFPDSIELFDPFRHRGWGYRLSAFGEGLFGGVSHRHGEPLYFAQGTYVYRFSAKESSRPVHRLSRKIEPGDRLINASPDGYLIYRSNSNELEELTAETIHQHTLPPDGEYTLLHQEKTGNIWVGNANQVYLKEAGTRQFREAPALPSGRLVNRIYEDLQGNVILGHLRPFLLIMSDLIVCYREDTLSLQPLLDEENRIIQLSGKDFRHEILAATYGGQLSLNFPAPQPSPFRNFLAEENKPSGEFGHVMRGFTADDAGNVYVNKDSKNPWWFRVNITDYSLDTLNMKDNGGQVVNQFGCGTNLINYRGDIYGMSCYRGEVDTGHVYRYRPADDSWKQWTVPTPNQIVRWIMKGRTPDELLLSCQDTKNDADGHLYYFYPARDSFALIQTIGPEFGIAGYPKSAKLDTTRNCIWLASSQGLYRFDWDVERLTRYQFDGGEQTSVSDVIIRESGHLLLGTFKHGLQAFNPEKETFTHVGGIRRDGATERTPQNFLHLPSSYVASIAVTRPDNYLIITTFNGLFFHGLHSSRTFSTDQGLPSNEFNTPSLFYNERDQRWYAGGINGFTSFKTEDLTPPKSAFSPLMVRYLELDEAVGHEKAFALPPIPTEPLTIKPSVAYFAFQYSLPDFPTQGVNKYQTRLVGYDLDWRVPSPENTVRYTRLPPGKYTFQLRAIDGSGRQSADIRELEVRVLKPWYQQLWFYLLSILGLASTLLYWHQTKMARMEKDYIAQRKVQSLELRALRQQLNPHFISNAVNSIREFIFSPDVETNEKAARYLTDFNQLMRLFLEASRHPFTSIQDERNMLDWYIGLEQIRFPGKFDYSIEVDPDIDPGMDELPSLLLQPIVENAIHHGLRHLKGGGELKIKFALEADGETIRCTISDNGVGRKIAASLNTAKEHVSRSTEILEDRRALLAEHDNVDLQVTTTDLYPEREHTGTVVTIRF